MSVIKTDGTLWMWGYNATGALGQNQGPGQLDGHSSPVQVGTDTTWKDIGSAGNNSVVAIKTDGTLWSWGQNDHGALGQNNANPVELSSPVQVGSNTTWSAVSKGGNTFGLATKTDGTLWTWGDNNDNNSKGVLGQNNHTDYSSPVQVGGTDWATGADKIATSDRAAIAIKANGTIYSWGGGYSGQLGQSNETQRSSPTQIGSASTWDTIAAGETHFIATKTDGTVWTWGTGSYGKLGLGNDNPKSTPNEIPGVDWGAAQVAGGRRSGMAIKSK
jgi:alpha-tubulin suppressor-like RCC1 family protein